MTCGSRTSVTRVTSWSSCTSAHRPATRRTTSGPGSAASTGPTTVAGGVVAGAVAVAAFALVQGPAEALRRGRATTRRGCTEARAGRGAKRARADVMRRDSEPAAGRSRPAPSDPARRALPGAEPACGAGHGGWKGRPRRPVSGDAYVDSASLALFDEPVGAVTAALGGDALGGLEADVTVLSPGAVILPIAIYR